MAGPAPAASIVTGAAMQTVPAVQIGGVSANVGYAGLASGFIGLYQMNVTAPANAASGHVVLSIATGIGSAAYDLWVQ